MILRMIEGIEAEEDGLTGAEDVDAMGEETHRE